jgi:hypothetical protein
LQHFHGVLSGVFADLNSEGLPLMYSMGRVFETGIAHTTAMQLRTRLTTAFFGERSCIYLEYKSYDDRFGRSQSFELDMLQLM